MADDKPGAPGADRGAAAMRVVFTSRQIQARVRELAAEIDALYEGERLVCLCVLKGAFLFFADLVRHLRCGPEIEFVRLASYGDGANPTGDIRFTKDIEISVADKCVLIIEDIVDSGYSMAFLANQLRPRGAKSVRICALVDKYERRQADVTVDFVGFRLEKGFIVGYGMDYAERHRELDAVYEMDEG